MAPKQRIVTASWYAPSGAPEDEGKPVVYELDPSSYTDAELISGGVVSDEVSDEHTTATALFVNTTGYEATRWTVTFPRGAKYTFSLPDGDDPIALPELIKTAQAELMPPSIIISLLEAMRDAIFAALANTINILLGAALVGWRQLGLGAVGRTVRHKLLDQWHVNDFGAIGDGTLHPLSEFYDTLEAAQEDYPFVTDLTESIDWAAIQAATNARSEAGGGPINFNVGYMLNRRPELKRGVYWKGPGRTATLCLDFTQGDDDAYNAAGDIDWASCIAAMGPAPVKIAGPDLPATPLFESVAEFKDTALYQPRLVFDRDMRDELSVGDVLMLQDPADFSHNSCRSNYHAGEYVIVMGFNEEAVEQYPAVDPEPAGPMIPAGQMVYLSRPTFAAYDASAVNVYLCDMMECGIEDMTIRGKTRTPVEVDPPTDPPTFTTPSDPAVTYFSNCTGRLVDKVEMSGSNWIHIFASRCHRIEIGARIAYLTEPSGLNYGTNLNNCQDVIMLAGNHQVTGRHGLSIGGAHAEGVPSRMVQIYGRYGGRGGSSVGGIGLHGNSEHIYFNDVTVENGLTLSGDYIYGSINVVTGTNPIALGGSEIIGGHIDLHVTVAAMAKPVSAQGSARGVIMLTIPPDCERGGTIKIHGTVDMGGFSGAPFRYLNYSRHGTVNLDLALHVHNTAEGTPSNVSLIRAVAGTVIRRVLVHDCLFDRAEVQCDGTNAEIIEFRDVRSFDAHTTGLMVLTNDQIEGVTRTRSGIYNAEIDRILYKTISVEVDDDGNVIDISNQFTLATSGDAIYFGYAVPFQRLALTITTANTLAGTVVWEYWNGSVWTPLTVTSDGTIAAGKPLAQSGNVDFTIPVDWDRARLGTDNRALNLLNYIRGRTIGALSAVGIGVNFVTTPNPVTTEYHAAIDCHVTGGWGAGVHFQAVDPALGVVSVAKIDGGNLSNNGSNPSAGNSGKTSYLRDYDSGKVTNVWVGDTRAPTTNPGGSVGNQTSQYYLDGAKNIELRDLTNVNPTSWLTPTYANAATTAMAPLSLLALPEYMTGTTTSPYYASVDSGKIIFYNGAHGTQDWVRCSFILPRGLGGTTRTIKCRLYGLSSEAINIRYSLAQFSPGETVVSFDVSNVQGLTTNETITTAWKDISICSFVAVEGASIRMQFRPRLTTGAPLAPTDSNIAQSKYITSLWME